MIKTSNKGKHRAFPATALTGDRNRGPSYDVKVHISEDFEKFGSGLEAP
jgi:hypothetical protein